jgi:hypothetical protein
MLIILLYITSLAISNHNHVRIPFKVAWRTDFILHLLNTRNQFHTTYHEKTGKTSVKIFDADGIPPVIGEAGVVNINVIVSCFPMSSPPSSDPFPQVGEGE